MRYVLAFLLLATSLTTGFDARASTLSYACNSILSEDPTLSEAWEKAANSPIIPSPRLIIRRFNRKEDGKTLLRHKDAVNRTIKESGGQGSDNVTNLFDALKLHFRSEIPHITSEYLIFEKASSKFVGFIRITWAPTLESLNFGGGILPDHRRKGFAREARTSLIKQFAGFGVEIFETAIERTNSASIALSKSLGFQFDGEAEYTNDDGRSFELNIYALDVTVEPLPKYKAR